MKHTRKVLMAITCASIAIPLSATAALTQWSGNGHYYESVVADGATWPAANTAANSIASVGNQGLRCYLATPTSSAEDQFVNSIRTSTPGINTSGGFANSELWLGGYQDPATAAPAASWFWVNSEGAFSYTHWLPGEPNDSGGSEQYLTTGWSNNFGWNDEASLDGVFGYVRECQSDAQANPDGPIEATSGVSKSVDVLANDVVNSGVAAVAIETQPASGGTATVGAGPSFLVSYTSPSNFEGSDTFTYRVTANNGAYSIATVTMTVAAGQATVVTGNNQLIFNQALNPAPNSNNPMTAAYQQVLEGGDVSIDCCRVLDTREGAGRRGSFKVKTFDLGLAVADTLTNPSCAGMPHVPAGKALLRPWQRGVPLSQGLIDVNNPPPADARENDLGVCFIQADVHSKGVVFSAEEAANVLGYSLNGAVPSIRYRPFTGGVGIDPQEVDKPYVTPWTAEWDESRSGKRFSDNLMVVNLWHEWLLMPSVPYLTQLAIALDSSIRQVKSQGCVENNAGFLNKLRTHVANARVNILLAAFPWWRDSAGQAAVKSLNDATRLAMLIGPNVPPSDPYGMCPGNPQGLFVGRMMSLKYATCSELLHPFDSASSLDGACKIEPDILCALPELPGFPHPASCPTQ